MKTTLVLLSLVVCASGTLYGNVQRSGYRTEIDCKEPRGWKISETVEDAEAGVEYLHLTLTNDVPAVPPAFECRFFFEERDIANVWRPDSAHEGLRPHWWTSPSVFWSSLADWLPLVCVYSTETENRFTFAAEECSRKIGFKTGTQEETCEGKVFFQFFGVPEAPRTVYRTRIRIDRRKVPFCRAVREATDWMTAAHGDEPAEIPAAAFDPVYSTWYAFHQDVHAADVEAECAAAAKLGMKTLIMDDGWQTDDTNRGYAFCGDWEVSTNRFPNMREHVARVHALGMRYVLWYSMPFVGIRSKNFERFKGKYLRIDEKGFQAGVLDPRFPEVRDFLAAIYEKAMRDWDLDGFKLDFINAFRLMGEPDPAIAEDFAGRDVRTIPEGLDLLLRDVNRRIKAIKPDALIEFRMTYIGPVVRNCGNMFRVADCCGSPMANRMGIASLRLTSGNAAVHSDMLAWQKEEPAETAARFVLASIFGTVQYSMMLRTIPEDHRKMIAHWIGFAKEHEQALQHGVFRALRPDANYPILVGESTNERIIGVYLDGVLVDLASDRRTIILNASGMDRVLVKVLKEVHAKVYNTFGILRLETSFKKGIAQLQVPVSGYVIFE